MLTEYFFRLICVFKRFDVIDTKVVLVLLIAHICKDNIFMIFILKIKLMFTNTLQITNITMNKK